MGLGEACGLQHFFGVRVEGFGSRVFRGFGGF